MSFIGKHSLLLFANSAIYICQIYVQNVFEVHVYPELPYISCLIVYARFSALSLTASVSPIFCHFFWKTYCNSRENRVYYTWRLRKTIVFRVWCREVPVGARHSRGFFRRKSVSTFQAAGEEPEVRALYRTVEWFRFLSEQFGWQHGAYSSHTMVDGYAFFHSQRRISYIIIRSRLC